MEWMCRCCRLLFSGKKLDDQREPNTLELAVLSNEEQSVGVPELDPGMITLGEMLGSGAFAEVYKGSLKKGSLTITVAVKKLNNRHVKKCKKAFDREVAILQRVRHPNLVQLVGVLTIGSLQIITEFCDGGTCSGLLYDPIIKLQWHQQHKMCLDIARGIEYLHKFTPPIIHRDLKSPNALLSKRVRSGYDVPTVMVSDFGLSRTKHDIEKDMRSTLNVGTELWMAPEARTSRYTEKVDVYSYAMVLFEIICRKIPLISTKGGLGLYEKRPDLNEVPSDCPIVMRDLMIKCWCQEPRQRPSFEEICNALEEVELPMSQSDDPDADKHPSAEDFDNQLSKSCAAMQMHMISLFDSSAGDGEHDEPDGKTLMIVHPERLVETLRSLSPKGSMAEPWGELKVEEILEYAEEALAGSIKGKEHFVKKGRRQYHYRYDTESMWSVYEYRNESIGNFLIVEDQGDSLYIAIGVSEGRPSMLHVNVDQVKSDAKKQGKKKVILAALPQAVGAWQCKYRFSPVSTGIKRFDTQEEAMVWAEAKAAQPDKDDCFVLKDKHGRINPICDPGGKWSVTWYGTNEDAEIDMEWIVSDEDPDKPSSNTLGSSGVGEGSDLSSSMERAGAVPSSRLAGIPEDEVGCDGEDAVGRGGGSSNGQPEDVEVLSSAAGFKRRVTMRRSERLSQQPKQLI